MDGIRFIMVFFAVLITPSLAEDKETATILEPKTSTSEFRSPRVSSEFGYRVQNSDHASSHFRQEHRDLNGVVRGSYGFTNPDGIFRLVQYVADDKGYRAHISSNEQGIGRQNPASVSINRFEQQEVKGHITSFKPPISTSRRQNLGQVEPQTEEHFPRFEFYSPIQTNYNSRFTENRNSEYPFLRDRDFYRTTLRRPVFKPISPQNPVEKFINTRLDIPRDIFSLLSSNEDGHISHPVLQPSSTTRDHFEYPVSQAPNLNSQDPTIGISNMNDFLNNLHTSGVISESYTGNNKDNKAQDITSTSSDYPQFLSNLFPNPHHKVHTSLPDCNSVTSAVLCKPPDFLSGAYFQRNTSKSAEFPFGDAIETAASGTPNPEIKTGNLENPSLSTIFEVSQRPDERYPQHSMTDSDIYRTLLGHKRVTGIMDSRHDRKCYKNHLASDGSILNYFIPSLEPKSHINDDVSNVLASYNQNRNDKPISASTESSVDLQKEDEEYFSNLIKIIRNDHSLNKLKDLLLPSSQLSTDSASTKETPRLSLLGILILPSHIIKELNTDDFNNSFVNKPIENDERNQTHFVEDIPQSNLSKSAVVDETYQYLDESHFKYPDRDINKGINSTGNYSVPLVTDFVNETNNAGYISKPKIPESWKNQLLFSQKNKINYTELSFSIKSPPFHVLNATEMADNDKVNNNKAYDKRLVQTSNSSSEDWRKILEEEISKEYKAVLQQQARFPDIPADIPPVPEFDSKTNQRQYTLTKHTGPLYDSTGRPIKPENVPIHIHRYIQPTGIPSLPWKFTIPRPAPPRSIIVPPKPPVLS